MLKDIEFEAVFTQTEMNNGWNVNFFLNTRSEQKNIETQFVFTKRENKN